MAKGKCLILCLVAILAVTSLLIVIPTKAQTIPKPSIPEFSLHYTVQTSQLQATYSVDPYTGQNISVSTGGIVNNQLLTISIKNQAFTPYYDSNGYYIDQYYNFRYRGHYKSEWTYLPFETFTNNITGISQVQTTHSYGPHSGGFFKYYNSSGLTETVFAFDSNKIAFPNKGQMDIQIQAQIGHIDDIPSGLLAGDFYKFVGESSDWSNSRTITIGESSITNAPTPSPTVPEFPITAILLAILLVVSFLLALGKRKIGINH